jgi:hypothetical protein
MGELKRYTPLPRGKGLKRARLSAGCSVKGPTGKQRARVNPVNSKRKRERHARNFGAEAEAVRGLPCLVCQETPCDPAHVTSRGAGGGRFDLVPLCRMHHDEQHAQGAVTFETRKRLDLRAEADRVALLHAPPLGVRGLAQRWAGRRASVLAAGAAVAAFAVFDFPAGIEHSARVHPVPEPLTDYEREALLGWVRRRMDAEVAEARTQRDSDSFARGWIVAVLEEVLGLHNRHAEALVDAAGWREVCEAAGWPPDDDDDFAGWPS